MRSRCQRLDALKSLWLNENKIGEAAIASAIAVSASLKLKELVVPHGLVENAWHMRAACGRACRAKERVWSSIEAYVWVATCNVLDHVSAYS